MDDISDMPSVQFLALASSWYENKTFSADWTSSRFATWQMLLKPYRSLEARVIEVGSFEGRSALFFLNYLPKARLVCIDTFEFDNVDEQFAANNGIDLEKYDPDFERQFDTNVAAFNERVEKIKGPSGSVLPELGINGRRFDIAYIDGSHRAVDVYSDAVLVWSMMVLGGIIIFDDYQWADPHVRRDDHDRPKTGVDAFLRSFEGQFRILHHGNQVIVQKSCILDRTERFMASGPCTFSVASNFL
jgi:predicted O-methyltransferase YrrM